MHLRHLIGRVRLWILSRLLRIALLLRILRILRRLARWILTHADSVLWCGLEPASEGRRKPAPQFTRALVPPLPRRSPRPPPPPFPRGGWSCPCQRPSSPHR